MVILNIDQVFLSCLFCPPSVCFIFPIFVIIPAPMEGAVTPDGGRRTRAALTEIPVRLDRLRVTPLQPVTNFRERSPALPLGYLSPAPSPDELLIQQRGISVIWLNYSFILFFKPVFIISLLQSTIGHRSLSRNPTEPSLLLFTSHRCQPSYGFVLKLVNAIVF